MRRKLDISDELNSKEVDYLFVNESLLPNAGKGLFTCIDIYKDEIICYYKGEIIGSVEAKKRAKNNLDQYFINLPNGKILDSISSTCFARFANDARENKFGSARNNAKIMLDDKGKVCLIARKKIKANEEIYCSYGNKYWLKHV
ncbi:MAG: SET domain-containing protein [Bacteroidia bacterium]|nr:SET domain-containing protein [Bacteroidia bacterium]